MVPPRRLAATTLLGAALAASSTLAAQQPPSAHVVLEKSVVEPRAVQGMNMTVALTAYNTGDGPATQVSISDTTWSPEAFEFVEGQPAATVESIEAGESFQHTFVLRPKSPGELSAPAATVSYTPFPNAEVQSGISTTIQGLTVFSPLENRVAQAVAVGRYLSLGYCQTVGDWMRVGFAVAAILVAIFGNSAFGSIQAANARRKREAAIKELQES